MHRAEDLEAAGAEFVCIWPEELVAYLQPGESCSLGVCSLPSAVPGPPPLIARVPDGPGAVRRRRRQQAAADLATAVAPSVAPATDCGCHESCCTGPTAEPDLLLRQVLTVLGAPAVVPSRQLEGERLSTRPEESLPSAYQELASMAAPNGGRVQPQ
jgi:hypothetical protein